MVIEPGKIICAISGLEFFGTVLTVANPGFLVDVLFFFDLIAPSLISVLLAWPKASAEILFSRE